MAAYRTPGLYREDVFPQPAPGLRTGVPALLGLAADCVAGGPQMPSTSSAALKPIRPKCARPGR